MSYNLTRAVNDIMRNIIPDQAQTLIQAYSWKKPCTHVAKVFPQVLTLIWY